MKYTGLLFLISQLAIFPLIKPVCAAPQTDLNPVVISYGDTRLTRRQFEQEFEMVMVLKAVETGVPVKNQDQIYVMEQRFLEQRAHEMVLLDEARRRGIKVSDDDLAPVLDEYMKNLGFSRYSEENIRRLGIVDGSMLKEYLRNRQIITILISDINNELEADDKMSTLSTVLENLYENSGIKLFPEFLTRPVND